MVDKRKNGWHSHSDMARRFAGLSPARRLELAEESEQFRREARIVEPRRNRRRAQ